MLKRILSIPSSILLKLMGWSFIDKKGIDIINNHNRMICVFSHTSYYDFFMMVLYYLSHQELNHIRVLINPWYFNILPLYWVGGIPAVKGGGVTKIVDELLKEEKSHFLISPKGTILQGEWKSGYYHIARQIKCPLMAIGVDYELKKITLCKPILSIYDEYHVQELLYKDLSSIVPLHPEQENMTIRKHNSKHVSVISGLRLGIFTVAIIIGLYQLI